MLHHNWFAIVSAALAALVIGFVWYSPLLFANAWMQAHAFSPEKLTAMRKTAPRSYGLTFLCFVLMAFVMHIFTGHLGARTAGSGAIWAFHAWLGFAFPIGLTAHLYSDKPLAAFLIDTSYQLVYMTAMGAILGGWN
jgi:hypothetical protein